jgi:cell division protein FtsL
MLIFIVTLLVVIFTLRFIVMYKSRRILAKIRALETQSPSPGIESQNPETKKLNEDVKQWLVYSKILNYIKLAAVIISVLGILLASAS